MRTRNKWIIGYIVIIAMGLIIAILAYNNLKAEKDYTDLSKEYEKFKQQSEQQKENAKIRESELIGTINELRAQDKVVIEPNKQSSTNSKKKKSEDQQVISRYSFVLKDTENENTDMNDDLILYGYKLMKKKGLDPSLLFGIIMVESEGHKGCKNPDSGAAGLGQFMEETGIFVYEKLMGKSGYDHEYTPYLPKTNIEMMVVYLDYLYDKYQGSTLDVLKQYCGGDEAFTYNYYLKVANWVGYCIH